VVKSVYDPILGHSEQKSDLVAKAIKWQIIGVSKSKFGSGGAQGGMIDCCPSSFLLFS
jgi:hypothetical protein